MKATITRKNNVPLVAGHDERTLIMALAGTSRPTGHDAQLEKIDALLGLDEPPDIIADLSIVSTSRPLWTRLVESGIAAAALPIYTVGSPNNKIDTSELLDRATEQMEGGVGLLTIHPTATHELIDLARQRIVPWTSRGGNLVIADLLASGGSENVYSKILPDLISAAARHRTTISIGATFRSANVFDSLDKAQMAEIEFQLELARHISRAGVGVIIESPGHARPRDILACAERLAPSKFPIMPLGPIPTDAAAGWDHVSAAIGATIMGMAGAAHILAAVTREEHTGGVPTTASTVEAVRAARVAAQVIDIHLLGATERDANIVSLRAKHQTCVAGKKSSGCSRCASKCPLLI